MSKAKIAFIGEEAAFAPFSALGLEFHAAPDARAAVAVLERLAIDEYALLVMTPAAAAAREGLDQPPVLVLPGARERKTGQSRLIAAAIGRATGRSVTE